MHIAMISYHTCPLASIEGKETGGMNVYVLELSRALAKLGHHVDIFTRSHESSDVFITDYEQNLRVIHIPAGPQEQISKIKLIEFIPKFVRIYKDFVQKEELYYDIIHAHYYQSGIAAIQIGNPFHISFHTLGLMKNLVARDASERESELRIRTEFMLMKRAQTIIAISDSDKAYMQYLYDIPENKIFVVYPGINPDLFHPIDRGVARRHIKADLSHKIVLFVGRIEPLKGIDSLFYATKILKTQFPDENICLWVVGGEVSDSRKLSDLQKTLGLETHVRFVGRQSQKELPYYYNAADVVVMPSHYESFGMSALEALVCGVSVITTNVAGISSLMSEDYTSHITSVNNPLLLASQIHKVLGLSHSTNHTPELMLRHQWSTVADQMLSAYKFDTIGKHAPIV